MYDFKAHINTLSGEKRTLYIDIISECADNVTAVYISGVSRLPIDGENGAVSNLSKQQEIQLSCDG